MMRWNSILAMYEKPMAESDFAAFLIRRYSLMTSLLNCKYESSFSNNLAPEFNLCVSVINKLTDKAVEEVLMELNKPKTN